MLEDQRNHYTTPIQTINRNDCEALIRLALAEDAPTGDPTTESIFTTEQKNQANLVTREDGVMCGLAMMPHLIAIYEEVVGGAIEFKAQLDDAQKFRAGDTLGTFNGSLVDLLRLERVMLNFLQYLSGIATVTSKTLAKVGTNISILDTRKTLPGYRKLAKYAVYCGGGTNHRIHLSDMAMIKDNHIAAAGGVEPAIKAVHEKYPELPLNVEVDTLEQLAQILAQPILVDVVLLDNMKRDQIQQASSMIKESNKTPLIELSGGWTPERLSELDGLFNMGVSMGYLTHTTRFLDLSLEIN